MGILLIPSLFQHKVYLIFFFLIQTCWLFFSSYRRGLSKHFQGKSQSFTSLSDVRCLGDLAKPENKKLKYCKSYSEDLDSHRSYSTKATSRTISKKASRGSCSILHAKRNSFLNNRPPIPPHRTSTLCNQTPLFAWIIYWFLLDVIQVVSPFSRLDTINNYRLQTSKRERLKRVLFKRCIATFVLVERSNWQMILISFTSSCFGWEEWCDKINLYI